MTIVKSKRMYRVGCGSRDIVESESFDAFFDGVSPKAREHAPPWVRQQVRQRQTLGPDVGGGGK